MKINISMNNSNILILFAPKFKLFGCDVGNEFISRKGGGKVHGLCTGPKEVMDFVQKNLGETAGHLWHLPTEEKKWLKNNHPPGEIAQIENDLSPGAMGRIIVADRRMGKGFVRGGFCRPDYFGQRAIKQPSLLPQNYVYSLYVFLKNVVELTKPDIVFCYAVAGAPALALAEICKSNNIPFARFTGLRIKSLTTIDTDTRGRLECVKKTFLAAKSEKGFEEKQLESAKQFLSAYRNNPEPPGYMKRNLKKIKKANPLKASVKALAGTIYHLSQSLLKGENRTDRIKHHWFEASSQWRKALLNTKPFSLNVPDGYPFIYYPLHVDPEASTMVMSPNHTDQVNVIEALAKAAPAGMLVVVKEHAPMLGKRPRHFYKTIAQIPRVVLLRPEHNGLSLIQKSSLTAVITGTAALEAILLKKPVLVMGDSPYLAIGEGTVFEPCLSKLVYTIPEAINTPPASDETLILYLAACFSESFELGGSLVWGTYEKYPAEKRQKAVKLIVDNLNKRLDRFFTWGTS